MSIRPHGTTVRPEARRESDTESVAQGLTGPVSEVRRDRSCTDIVCLAGFAFLALCLLALSCYSWATGFPGRMTRGSDLYGDACGFGELEDKSYTFFLNPVKNTKATLCLSGCPIAISSEAICLYDSNRTLVTDYDCFDSYITKPFFNRYCLPADHTRRTPAISYLFDSERVMSRVMGDLAKVTVTQAWDILAIAGLITGAVCVIYVLGLRFHRKNHTEATLPLFILSAVGASFLLSVMCYLVYHESERMDDHICGDFGPISMVDCDEGDTASGYEALCWVLLTVAIVSLSTLGCMVPAYKSSLDVIRKTTLSSHIRLSQFAVPLTGLILGIAIYAYFIVLAVYQSSSGDTSTSTSDLVPQGEVVEWVYDSAGRVLIFFTVLMALWCFSLVAHSVEFVTGGSVMQYVFRASDCKYPVIETTRYLIAFHLGTVLFASILIPMGRLPRNLLQGLRTWTHRIVPRVSAMIKPCEDWYEARFKYMTSDGLAYQSFSGKSLRSAFKESSQLLTKHDSSKHSTTLLNDGNYYIWLSQLTLIMIAPVFTAYWIQFTGETFQGRDTREVTSVTAMSFFALFFSWFVAQVYGGFARGLLHANMFAYLIDLEYNTGSERKAPSPFRQLMGEEVTYSPRRQRASIVKQKEETAQEKDAEPPSNSFDSQK